jgi:putative ABC transport system ATP-binding protein
MIEVVALRKVYGKKEHEFTALDDVSFHVESGSSVAIVGKSGSGKSTLMHIMSGLDHPSKGAVIVDGDDISGLKQKALDTFRAEKIGFIFQSFFVQANESCYNNVALPLEITHVSGAERKKRVHSSPKTS